MKPLWLAIYLPVPPRVVLETPLEQIELERQRLPVERGQITGKKIQSQIRRKISFRLQYCNSGRGSVSNAHKTPRYQFLPPALYNSLFKTYKIIIIVDFN